MADNFPLTPGSGRNAATDQVAYSGDTADVQLVRPVLVTGSEGSKTVVDLAGDASNGLDVDVTRVQGTVAISAASLPLPSGAATAAKQPALGTAGSASADVVTVQGVASMTPLRVDGSAATQPVSGTVGISGGVAVTGTFWQATQPVSGTVTANAGTGTFAVSAATLPLPSGASTAAKQPALGTAGTAASDVLTIQGIASMTAVKVDGSAVTQPVSLASLPALATGSNPIGSITNTTFAATQSGTWNVGTVTTVTGVTTVSTVTTVGTVSAVTAVSDAQVQGKAAQGASVSGNPVLMGGEARESNPTAVTTGQAVRFSADRLGRQHRVRPKLSHASSNGTPITTATDTAIVAAPAAGNHLVPHRVQVSNGSSTATWVYLRDGVAGTKLFAAYLAQGATGVINLEGLWHLTSATALYLTTSAAGSVEWTASTETIAD
jgi:hypothetical protein